MTFQASSLTGEDRRTFLQRLISVAAAAPLAGALAASWPAAARATTLSSAQMAGQRVIFSYPGLTVPSALLDQIRAGEAAGVMFGLT
jgi:beta-N-acetylhexosaminidase